MRARHLAIIAAALAIAVSGTATAAAAPSRSHSAAAGNRAYFVITQPGNTTAAKTAIQSHGGTVYASYDKIGVIVAHSSDGGFADAVRDAAGVQQVGATRTSDVPAAADNPAIPAAPSETTPTAAETARPDMTQIGADKAWKINQGSKSVTVGILDTGVDDRHYDLKANFDKSRSASCAYGKVDTRPGSWRPVASHGTHVAGTIAAAKNGKGMVGVAPKVTIAAVRVAEDPSGLFFPENTVCAFVFAADHHFRITNNSYYTDPWLFNCPSDPDQKAILTGVKRAAAYADNHGVLTVAAAGNEDYDLAHKTNDPSSPDDSTPADRPVTNDCLSLPTELPGVVRVAALNGKNGKSSYSNYGEGLITVAAPGDSVYSTLPGGGYGQMSGTSMATPHVVGVAALLASVHPNATPDQLRGYLARQADDLACPAGEDRCTGTKQLNSFFGEGRVDAAQAVQR
jgi:subtilisin family serine protease